MECGGGEGAEWGMMMNLAGGKGWGGLIGVVVVDCCREAVWTGLMETNWPIVGLVGGPPLVINV